MTSHCITWHDTTQAITSHQMTWPSHDLTPEQTSRHQNTSLQSTKHHHHGRAEGSFTAKKWFGHRAGRSPCAHSIGKFFLCYIVLFLLETSAPGLSGHYWYMIVCDSYVRHPVCFCLRDLVPLKSFRFYDLLLSLVCSLVQYWASLISRKNLPQPKAFLSQGQVSGSSSVNIISPKKSPPQHQFKIAICKNNIKSTGSH